MNEEKINLKAKIRVLIKKIIHLNFLTRFLSRIILQRSYKTFRLFTNMERLKGTLWLEWNKELFDTWARNKNNQLYIEATNFYSKFTVHRNRTIKGLPISGGVRSAKGGGGANEALLYFLVRCIN